MSKRARSSNCRSAPVSAELTEEGVVVRTGGVAKSCTEELRRRASLIGSSPALQPWSYSVRRRSENGSGHQLGSWGHLHRFRTTTTVPDLCRRPHSFWTHLGHRPPCEISHGKLLLLLPAR